MASEWRPEELPEERNGRAQRNIFPLGADGRSANPTPVPRKRADKNIEPQIQFAYDYMTVP